MRQGRRIEYCAETLHRLWARGASYQEIAAALGCGESFVHKLKIRHKLPNRQKPTREIYADDPTPEQIEIAKAQLRQQHLAEMRDAPVKHMSQAPGIRVYSVGPNPFRLVS